MRPTLRGAARLVTFGEMSGIPVTGTLGVDQGAILSPTIPFDLGYDPRDAAPDVGAFEHRPPAATVYLPVIFGKEL